MRLAVLLISIPIILIATSAQTYAASISVKEAKSELAKLYKISDPGKLEKAVKKLNGKDIKPEDATALFSEALKLQATPPKKLPQLKDIHEGAREYVYEVKSKSAKHANFAMLDLPRGVSANKPAPLLIALHSTQGTAWRELRGLRTCAGHMPKRELSNCLVVAPNALNRGNTADDPTRNPKKGDHQYFLWGPKRQGIDTVLILIEGILRDFNVDRNRIYLTGMGQGGVAAFHLAQLMPSMFAGVCIRDGLPPHYYADQDYIKDDAARKSARRGGELNEAEVKFPWAECYRNTPIHWVHADDDKTMLTAHARKCIADMKAAEMPVTDYEYEGFHGSGPTEMIAKALAATLNEKRTNYPTKVTARGVKSEKWTRGNGRNYWVNIVKESYTKKGGGWEYRPLAGSQVTVEADKSTNTITVTGAKGMKLELYLNNELLYVDQEVTLIVNGKERKVRAKHDLGVLCDTTSRFRWTGEVYTAMLDVSVS
ncbi:MAG: alpha/beta hydrolase family protein [Planctomycetota bacterium]|jgi:predicted esterase